VSRRAVLAVLLSVLLVAPLSAVLAGSAQAAGPRERATWQPPLGPVFNNPVGARKARTATIRRVIAAINHTPKSESIRMAMYSFDRQDVFEALVRARKRGAHIQMLVNDNWTSRQTRRLRKMLGHNPRKPDFLRVCKASCRGPRGNLHMKVYSFTRTGGVEKVIITGSSNLTDRAVQLQWNDLYTIADSGLYDAWLKVFNEAKYDVNRKKRWVIYSDEQVDANWYRTGNRQHGTTRRREISRDRDPVLQRLNKVSCKTEEGFGSKGRTRVRIMMYGWSGTRGKYLAERVAYLERQGCDVRVILSVPGGGVVKTLSAAHIPTRSADWKFLDDGTVDFYSHLKVLAVNGTYDGKPTRTVWTGSENWSDRSFNNDELTIHISGGKIYFAYQDKFSYLWSRQTHRVGVRPTGLPPR
jgi:phosphatidylserine/phosphatidylglycerophosphate/cardiolipin synthase-like enzyme